MKYLNYSIIFFTIVIIYLLNNCGKKINNMTICSWNVEWFGYSKKKNINGVINNLTDIEKLLDNLFYTKDILYEMNAGIICLQEVSSLPVVKKLNEYMSNYKLYYPKSIEVKNIKNKNNENNENHEQFNVFLVDKNVSVIEFNEITKKLLHLKVYDKTLKKEISIYNIHLKSDYDKDSSEKRQEQINNILSVIKGRNEKNIVICGDFNSELGSKELSILDYNGFVNILISRKNSLPNIKKNTLWKDVNNNQLIDNNELQLIDYFYTTYNLLDDIKYSYIKFIFYQKANKNDILFKISDHYPIILHMK